MLKPRREVIFIQKTGVFNISESACFNFDCCKRCLVIQVEKSGDVAFPGCLLKSDDATSITSSPFVFDHVTKAIGVLTILTRLHVLDRCMIAWRSHCLLLLVTLLSSNMANTFTYAYRIIHRQYTLPQYPSLSASRAKFDPTVLLALLPTHFPISGPSTLYFVPKGTLCIPLAKYAWVVLTIASWTAREEAPAATRSVRNGQR